MTKKQAQALTENLIKIAEKQTRPRNSMEWTLIRETEERIKTRLGRAVLLDQLSVIELEQLSYLSKEVTNEQLTLALNEILKLD